MARDAELDRLKTAQDLAFQRKQDAYQAQQRAWEKLSSARDALSRAHEEKQRAYTAQNSSWQEYQQIRSQNGPRIDRLNEQQEAAYQNMRQAFDNASSAYESGDGAAAKRYAEEGHRYKAESQRYVAERRRLVDGIRSARTRHEATKPAFQRAKEVFNSAKRTFDKAKAEHEQAQAKFKQAKGDFTQVAKAFKNRLEKVKAEHKKRKSDKRRVAEQAGVPSRYLDDVWLSRQPDGKVNIYFGGAGKPNGPGHGHYVLDQNEKVTYRRDPFDPHGPHNFADAQRDYADVIGEMIASSGEFGFRCRFCGYDAHVESNVNQQGKPKIDIYYGPNGPFGPGHHHAVAYRDSPYEFVADELR